MKMAKMALRQIQVIKQELAAAELPAKVHYLKTTITTFDATSTVVPSRPGTQAWAVFFTPQNLDLYHFETNQRNCLEVSNKVCSFAAE